MKPVMLERFDDVGECADAILRRVGPSIVLATPLGIGKPNALLNEIYRRVARDPTIKLEIITALSLNPPDGSSDLERRFLGPLIERFYGDYPDLEYLKAIRVGRLAKNIRVHEFFLAAGTWLRNDSVQRDYVSINYSDVVTDLVRRGVNVLVQSLAQRVQGGREQLSLSSNPDLSIEVLRHFDAERARGRTVLAVGSVNRKMPFMLGDAQVTDARFDMILDHDRYEHEPFQIPSPPIRDIEHAIGLNVAALVRDQGTVQIGIGELGEACVYSLGLRQHRNDVFRHALGIAGIEQRFGGEIAEIGGLDPFERGLYACTEMFFGGLLELFRSGILSRRVYPHAQLQRLVDEGVITSKPNLETLVALARAGVDRLDRSEFSALSAAGLFAPGTRHEGDVTIISPDGVRIDGRLANSQSRELIAENCLSKHIDGGRVLDGAFLLGTRAFYASLRELAEDDRRRFNMTSVSFTNTLSGADFALKCAQRINARFINSAMMVTGLGAAVSDGLEGGQVVSGVGGQNDFVAQAHALPGARSVLMLRSTRFGDGACRSNIRWSYGHTTIPRQSRDVIVTEYGIASLRGRSDSECVKALIAITDARFQRDLLASAKRAGKIERDFEVPDQHRNNTPERISDVLRPLRQQGVFSEFPFGCDYTREEIVVLRALSNLANSPRAGRLKVRHVADALLKVSYGAELKPYLDRLGIPRAGGWREALEDRVIGSSLHDSLHYE
jgi:acyl-CoA hydrolase